jgi:peptide/nickel transport system ATP-binding protein
MDDAELRKIRGKEIAMIFQDPMTSLNPVLTVGRQIREALETHFGMDKKAGNARAAELLDQVGIPSAKMRLKDYPHQFSGGMRQRAMIAMALACEPKLLIADEPTTALDVTIQAQILHLLAEIQRDTGIGLILISHDLGVVAGIAHRIAVMYGGEIVEIGERDAVLGKPLHPYTEGLMRSIPVPGETRRGETLGFIPGTVPRQAGELTRCGFIDRCPYANARSAAGPIPLRAAPDGRLVRCVLPTDGSGRDPDAWTRLAEGV